jgi:predicted RNase H-like HicB family nuclease
MNMSTLKFVHWQDGDQWLGYLQDYPDYWTQGESFDDLKEHLKDLYEDLTSGQIPEVRKVDELVIP